MTKWFKRQTNIDAKNWGLALALAVGLTLFAAPRADAQQMSPGAALWGDSGCTSCHGGVGQGGGGGENPAGPDLWRARLNRDALIDVIACGREKTGMPYHLAGAFKQKACWGRPLGEPPAEAIGGGELSEQQIATMVDFLVENVVGKGPITKAKCAAFFGNNPNNPACGRFP